jgi:hypothetical protein
MCSGGGLLLHTNPLKTGVEYKTPYSDKKEEICNPEQHQFVFNNEVIIYQYLREVDYKYISIVIEASVLKIRNISG